MAVLHMAVINRGKGKETKPDVYPPPKKKISKKKEKKQNRPSPREKLYVSSNSKNHLK